MPVPAGGTIDALTDVDPSENTILAGLGIVRAAPVPSSGGGGATGPAVESVSLVGTTVDWLNVREGPDLSAARIDVLRRGARVDVIGRSGRWFAVLHGGSMRYVMARFVRVRP